ncbi:MAG: GNAT family N-acetyltransferase [Planctomycetes bacterium]|nr:GNAT family N-acetyltransferase [Planctomycetota bacterium]
MPSVQEINDLTTLRHYEAVWGDLLAATPGASFFQSYDWFVCRVTAAAADLKLRVLIVSDDRGLIGILPLIVSKQQRRVGRFRVLGYPLSDWGSLFGPIGPDAEATLAAGLEHVRGTPRDWDVLDLCWVDRDHTDAGLTQRMMARTGLPAREMLHATTAQVELGGDWVQYWASRKSHWRTNVRRSEKRLAAQGTVRHVRFRPGGSACGDDDSRWDLFDTCVELAARSWQADAEKGTTMSHASVTPLLRTIHEAAVRRGAVDLNLLTIDDRPVAFAYNYHYRGYVYGLRMGYDHEACHDGAGSVLLCRTLEDSFRRGDRIYDLGPDYLECKRQWWTRLVPTYRYTHFPWQSPRAQAVRLGRWVSRRVRAVTKDRSIV